MIPYAAINNSLKHYQLTFSQQQDLADDAAYYTQRADELASFVTGQRAMLEAYITFCDENGFLPDEAAYNASESICQQIADMQLHMRTRIGIPLTGKAYYKNINEIERLYRAATLLKVGTVRVLSWSSPAYGQSMETFHFQPEQYGGIGDRFNYDRTESPDVRRWRNQMKDILEVPDDFGLVCLSSGMAAFTLLFQYLVQRVLTPGFTIYVPRLIYGETDLLMQENSPLYKLVTDEMDDAQTIAGRIAELQPEVVLLEGMRNGQGNPLIDMVALIEALNNTSLTKDVYLLADETLLTGAYLLAPLVTNPRLKVYQYYSAMKYLQLGLDAGLAGAVVVPKEQELPFRRMASYLGLVLYDTVALTYPAFTRQQFLYRQHRLTRNAYVMATVLQNAFGNSGLKALHPLQANHPYHQRALNLSYVGTLVSLDVTAITGQQVSEKNLMPLITLLEKTLSAAKRKSLSIAASESFGLGTPRITVNWCKRTRPYLRISAGDRSIEETTAIAECIAEELLRHLPAKAA